MGASPLERSTNTFFFLELQSCWSDRFFGFGFWFYEFTFRFVDVVFIVKKESDSTYIIGLDMRYDVIIVDKNCEYTPGIMTHSPLIICRLGTVVLVIEGSLVEHSWSSLLTPFRTLTEYYQRLIEHCLAVRVSAKHIQS